MVKFCAITMNQAIDTTILIAATISIVFSREAIDIDWKASTAGHEIA